jgi:type IV pilus assembly protein PilB
MSAKSFGERIAHVLIEDGIITQAQLEEAMALQKKQGGRLLKLLIDKKYVTEEDMVISTGRCLDTPPINLSKVSVPADVLDLIPRELARNYKVAPVCRVGNKLYLAMADPLNVLALDDIRQRTKMEIIPMITPESSLGEVLSGVNKTGPDISEAMKGVMDEINPDELEISEIKDDGAVDLDQMAREGREGPVVRLVNIILLEALKKKASDIHIEPYEKNVRLRYRVDGQLVEASSPPKQLQNPMASRIKILAGLDIAEKRKPQDGRFRIKIGGRNIDLRISVLPVIHGEKVVLRILDKGNLSASMDALGMPEDTAAKFRKAVDAPHGMVLVTGPTGSGKTTTLYSVLQEMNKISDNIITAEDPVEYEMFGINQVQVKREAGLTFATALKAMLRQDPDTILVGEIRDLEAGGIAVEAALTGHKVLSTLHTNDAPGAITRLDDMGVAPFLISSAVLLSTAQRLVRRICTNCLEEFRPEPEIFDKLGLSEELRDAPYYQGAGCDRCGGKGYAGRAAIIEAMLMSDTLRKLVMKRASGAILKRQAINEGMKTLRMAGIEKALEGITTLTEVFARTSEE